MLNAGEDAEQQEPWFSASRNTNWYSHFGRPLFVWGLEARKSKIKVPSVHVCVKISSVELLKLYVNYTPNKTVNKNEKLEISRSPQTTEIFSIETSSPPLS